MKIKNTETLQVEDASLYFEMTGFENAPPLLVLHGGMGNLSDFDNLRSTLSQTHHVIALDSRGHGRSTLGKSRLSYQRLEQDVLALLQHLKLKEVAVLGFSDGGTVGYRLMANPAVKVSRLATIGAPYTLSPEDPIRDIYAGVTAEGWRQKFPNSAIDYQKRNPEPDFDHLLKNCVEMWIDTSEDGYPGKKIEHIAGDVLVIRGDRDHLFRREQAFDLMQQLPQSAAFLNIPFAGHMAHEDQQEICLLSLKHFFNPSST